MTSTISTWTSNFTFKVSLVCKGDCEMSVDGRRRLLEILETMDVPQMRLDRRDWKWMMRNISVNNSGHPDLKEVVQLLREAIEVDNRRLMRD